MNIRLLSVAETEFSDAAAYYEDIEQGLGDRFIDHITSSVGIIEQHPFVGHLIEDRVRKLSLRNFPYNIIYHASENEIVIVAIAHHKRKPHYWRDRLLKI
ncbi:MAG: type II toxin-antitoxin system RelE/ParE family toxin [Acidobacteria bacterium]|nr:type II toxin-antitoxin system RelE/ParE family toxin [Acidobacteriota bacterium]